MPLTAFGTTLVENLKRNPYFATGTLLLIIISATTITPNLNQSSLTIPTADFNQVLGKTYFQNNPLPKIVAPPYLITNPQPFPTISAPFFEIFDRDSRVEIKGLRQNEKVAPASLTKLMTALISLKEIKLDSVITVDNPVYNGSNMGLLQGEQITFENLLWGLFLPSGNDAAYAIAQYVGEQSYGGQNSAEKIAKFVAAMNQEAAFLKLENTSFANPAGLDQNGHYSTVFDLARLTDYALRFPLITSIVQTPQATVSSIDGKISHNLRNTNDLLGKIPGVTGVKTGTTPESGESIILDVFRNGHEVLFVIVGSTNRDQDASQMINWVFENYRW